MSTNKVQVMYELLTVLVALTTYSVYREVKQAPEITDDEALEQIAYEAHVSTLDWAELLAAHIDMADKANMVTVCDPLISELDGTGTDTVTVH